MFFWDTVGSLSLVVGCVSDWVEGPWVRNERLLSAGRRPGQRSTQDTGRARCCTCHRVRRSVWSAARLHASTTSLSARWRRRSRLATTRFIGLDTLLTYLLTYLLLSL